MSLPLALTDAKNLSLTTFRSTGAAVSTPVWFAAIDDELHVITVATSGKVKRIRANPAVRVGACTRVRGTLRSELYDGNARIVPIEDEPEAHLAVTSRYGLQSRIFQWQNRRKGVPMTMITIRLDRQIEATAG